MDKKLIKTREEIFKKCPAIFWEVSLFLVIFAIAMVALDSLIPGLSVIIFGVLFFPLLYSTFMTLYTIKFGGTVTVKSTYAISISYFKRNSFGCFRILRCLLFALLADVLAAIVFSIALDNIFTSIYGSVFTDSFQQLIDLYYSGDIEALNSFLLSDNCAAFYLDSVTSFSLTIGIAFFIFEISYNSPNVYLCANIPNATAAFSTTVFKNFLRRNSRSYRKDFWSLNWPMFVLLLIGMTLGYVLAIALDIDFTYGLPISTMFGLVCLIPFAPFFFAGMEALFAKYNEKMRKASADLTQSFLRNLKENANLSDEDKAKIEELLSKENKKDDTANPDQNKNDNQEK